MLETFVRFLIRGRRTIFKLAFDTLFAQNLLMILSKIQSNLSQILKRSIKLLINNRVYYLNIF